MSSILSSFYSKTITATDDAIFRFEDDSTIVLASINIHCYTNDCDYGNPSAQAGIIRANAVAWFDAPVRLADIVFKNHTAGSNTTIVITGPVLLV